MLKKAEHEKKKKQLIKRTQKIIGKSTRVLKTMLYSFMIIITLGTVFTTNSVRAENISNVELHSKDNLFCFKYKGILTRCEFVVYNHNGNEYPAYCLNRELEGVSLKTGGYTVSAQDLITNDLIWRAIINGYPYKTYQELGCNNEMEAFEATKFAAYDMMYNYNLDEFIPVNDVGERVVAAIKRLSYIARNSTQTKINPQIQIQSVDEQWQMDEKENEYISKKFKLNANAELSNYIVEIKNIDGAKITDLENQTKNQFNKLDEFKILIPIDTLTENKQIQINASADLKTYPIYYGKAPVNLQNYAISGLEYENTTTMILEDIPKNQTSLTIEKVDAETKEKLENFEFLVKKDDTEQSITVVTNKEGKIELSKLLPGEYTITEISGASNYIIKSEPIKVKVEFNKQQNILIENNKKIETEIQIKQIVETPLKLPKTGF